MRKNYFMKNLVAASMLLAVSMGMSSCSGFVDAVLGTSDKPTTQPTTQPTTPTTPTTSIVVTPEQSTLTTSSLADLANTLTGEQKTELENAIKAKAAANEEYTINIKSEQPLSTENFEGFEIPRVEGSKINIVIDQPVVTSETSPLKITAEEKKSETSTTAVNELAVTLPAGASKVYLSLDMPETTVTLAGEGSYEFVKALTATNTLYISVPVDELQVNGGSVVVMAGGSIETLVCPTSSNVINISSDGVGGNTFWYSISDDRGNPYYVDNLKIIKGDADYASLVHKVKSKLFKKLIIGDGAAVNYNRDEFSGDILIETIEGLGTSKFLYGITCQNITTGEQEYYNWADLKYVKNVHKVIFSPLWETPTDNDPGGSYKSFIESIPNNADSCSFEASAIYLFQAVAEYQAQNNTYKFTEYFDILIPCQSSTIPSSKYIFDKCKFSDYQRLTVVLDEKELIYNADGTPKMIWYYFDASGGFHKSDSDPGVSSARQEQDSRPATFIDYKGTVEFNNCTYGASAISKDLPFLQKGLFNGENIDLKFVIDGTTYTPTYGPSMTTYIDYEITLN